MEVIILILLIISTLIYSIRIGGNFFLLYKVFIQKDEEITKAVLKEFNNFKTWKFQLINNSEHILVYGTYFLTIFYILST